MKNVLVAVAWPYANAEIHVGNLTGSYLPADIFARYHRLKGNRVLMVSGSDAHGTPITVRADAEGTTAGSRLPALPRRFLELFQKAGITYDLFTSTHTANHFRVSQEIFRALKQNGYLYRETQKVVFRPARSASCRTATWKAMLHLRLSERPQRPVRQLRQPARPHPADRPAQPHRRLHARAARDRAFLPRPGQAAPRMVEFLASGKETTGARTCCASRWGNMGGAGLHGRPITRDLDWGIPVPMPGWEGKCLYVWFEAVIGYLSASHRMGEGQRGARRLEGLVVRPGRRHVLFHRQRQHSLPRHHLAGRVDRRRASCMPASGRRQRLSCPTTCPANEFMNLEGQKICGSRNWAVWGLDFLERYDPDPLRYYLTINMPETRDTDWDWNDFFHRNNDELVATWGNLANRVLSFAWNNWEGRVPEPGELRPEDNELLAKADAAFGAVGARYEQVQLRAALGEAMTLAGDANRYLDQQAPWFQIKTDKAAAAKSVFTALRVINSLKTLLAPVIPFSAESLQQTFGARPPLFGTQRIEGRSNSIGTRPVLVYDPAGAAGRWEPSQLEPGAPISQPKPLFRKLLPEIVEEERGRLGKPSA